MRLIWSSQECAAGVDSRPGFDLAESATWPNVSKLSLSEASQ